MSRLRSATCALLTVVLLGGLGGVALAAHVSTVSLTPDSDVAALGTCNAFTVAIAPAQSTVVDVQISQSAPAGTGAGTMIGFCNPGPEAGQNVQAAPTAGPTGTVTSTSPGTVPISASHSCQGPNPTPAAGAPNSCNGEYRTDTAGVVTFGVTSDQVGSMSVLAYVEESTGGLAPAATGNNVPTQGEPADVPSSKTWVAGGTSNVTRVDCTPKTDNNPEGTSHVFFCTAFTNNPFTNQRDVPVPGVRIWFDVVGGPNADEIAPTPCSADTDNNGRAACSYTDNTRSSPTTPISSPPGTDSIVAYVNADPANGPAGNNPADVIAKTWVGPARNIVCDPRAATNPSGTVHTITCTVTDVGSNPVGGQTVRFTESGPGRFTNNLSTFTTSTNASGVATAQTTSFSNEVGTQSVVAELMFANPVLAGPNNNCVAPNYANCNTAAQQQAATGRTQECQQPAGTTTATGNPNTATTPAPGSTAGNCADSVTKTWTDVGATGSPSPTGTATATATATATVTATATQTATPTATVTDSPCAFAQAPRISVSPSTILAGQGTNVTVSGTPGTTVEVLARMSGQQYVPVRRATIPQAGSVFFILTPRSTTRVAARACGLTSTMQPIISVRARISLTASPLAGCVVRFSGSTLPVKPGQLVNVYYRNASGAVTLAIQARTASNGSYAVQRRFTGCGQVITFFSRVNADVHNLAGQSPDRRVTIRR